MIATASKENDIDEMTLQGLDETQEALEQLKQECRVFGELLLTDVAKGAQGVIETANSIHQFIMFEQEVIRVFSVDTPVICFEDDSLFLAEKEMSDLLERFNVCMDTMDLVGISELLSQSMPELLTRFQQLLVVLRTQIYDHTTS